MNDLLDDYQFYQRAQILSREENSKISAGFFPSGEILGASDIHEEYFRKAKVWLQQHSILYIFVREIIKSNITVHPIIENFLVNVGLLSPYRFTEYAPPEHPVIQEAWRKHSQNIVEFKELAQKSNAKLLFVLIPRKEQVYSWLRGWHGVDPEGPNKKLRHFMEAKEIDYIDLLPLFKRYSNPQPRKYLDREKDLYWRYDGHFNIKGNHLIGLLVSKYVIEKGLSRIKDKQNVLKRIDQKLAHFH